MNDYVFKLYGLNEEDFKNKLLQIGECKSCDCITENNGLDLKVTFIPKNPAANDFDVFIKSFLSLFDDNIYALRDISLQEQLVDVLKIDNLKISVAESFTGGNVAASIISVSGASAVFYEGIVAYNEESKIERLGVTSGSLKKYKAVSSVVAEEMAIGLIRGGKCDIAVSTTGLAGPCGDGSGLPVGLCYVGIACFGEVHSYKFNFKGSRDEIISNGVGQALLKAIKCLTLQINR